MTTQNFAQARVVIFTADACLTANLETSGERVKDLLNGPNTLIELFRVSYANPDRPGVAIAEYATGVIRKSDVGCVVVISEPPQTTMKKLGTYIQKRPTRVSVLIPGMVVIGTLHTQGRYDPSYLLNDALEPFTPLTQAGVLRARTTTPTSDPPERLTVFVNRAHITGVLTHDAIEAGTLYSEPELVRSAPSTGLLSGTGSLATGGNTPGSTGRLRRLSNSESSW